MANNQLQELSPNGRGVDVTYRTGPGRYRTIERVHPNVVACAFRHDEEYFTRRDLLRDGEDLSRPLTDSEIEDFERHAA